MCSMGQMEMRGEMVCEGLCVRVCVGVGPCCDLSIKEMVRGWLVGLGTHRRNFTKNDLVTDSTDG